jgi:predicted nuclease of restriction endonuclease-like (RecB) superfamily
MTVLRRRSNKKNSWGVHELKRAMGSLLFERIGLSTGKKVALEKYSKEVDLKKEEVFEQMLLGSRFGDR